MARPKKPTVESFTEHATEIGVMQDIRKILLNYGVRVSELIDGKNRMHHVTKARGDVYLFMSDKYEWTDTAIARMFGHDHTSVRYVKEQRRKKRGHNS